MKEYLPLNTAKSGTVPGPKEETVRHQERQFGGITFSLKNFIQEHNYLQLANSSKTGFTVV